MTDLHIFNNFGKINASPPYRCDQIVGHPQQFLTQESTGRAITFIPSSALTYWLKFLSDEGYPVYDKT